MLPGNNSARPRLVLDARLINTSGIGTVIQNTLPHLISFYHVILLGKVLELNAFSWASSCQIIEFDYPVYSLGEQAAFLKKVPSCDIFFSPHYNIPLLPIRANKRVVIIHDVNHVALADELSLFKKIYARLVIGRALKLSDQIITVSNFSKAEILKYFKVPAAQIQVITLGVNKTYFNLIPASDQNLIRLKYDLPANFVLYVGNVKPHKNLKVLVRAMGLYKKENPETNLKLVIVGKKDGFITPDNFLINLISLLGIQNDVIFTGYVVNEDLPVLYNLAQMFVFPSLYEGFGLPPVEAMACGCPVLASEFSSVPEVCKDAALYFNPTDPAELCRKITHLINNQKGQDELKVKGLALAQTYNWIKTGQQLLKIIGQPE